MLKTNKRFCRRIFFVKVFLPFRNYFPMEKGVFSFEKKNESATPRDALCQVWLSLIQWFWIGIWKCKKQNDDNNDNDDDVYVKLLYTETVCAEYNIGVTCIQRNGEVTCDACPILYKSTESFKCNMICVFRNKVAWGVTYPIAICFCSTSFIVRHACRPTPVTFIFLVSRTYLGIAFFVKAIVVEGIQPIWKITTSF